MSPEIKGNNIILFTPKTYILVFESFITKVYNACDFYTKKMF